MVARTWERIILPISVPASGLCSLAWLWLWSWPSMPCRSARRRRKRSSTPKLIPSTEDVVFETDIWTESLLTVDLNGVCERGKQTDETCGSYWNLWNCEFVVHLMRCPGWPQLWWSTWLYKGPLVEKASKWVTLPLTVTQHPGELKLLKDHRRFLTEGGREEMSNIIKDGRTDRKEIVTDRNGESMK